MVKVLIVIIIGAGFFLFYPQYNLLEATSDFGKDYELHSKNYWSRDDCKAAGRKLDHKYKCIKTNGWENVMGKGVDYATERDYDSMTPD